MTSLPTLPKPGAVAVADLIASLRPIYERRDELIGVLPLPTADELRRQATAIETYLAGTEGEPHAQRAARVLEMAVGKALGTAKAGRHREPSLSADNDQSRQLRHEFRQLANGRAKIEPYLDDEIVSGGVPLPRGLSREAALRIAKGAHISANAGESEWYTPAEYIAAAREVMGEIDLDPASSAVANEIVGAATFYTREDDGLTRPWAGRVWMNPPYKQPACSMFAERLVDEFGAGNVTQACVLVNNATETEWFQGMAIKASAIAFPNGRVPFWHPERLGLPLQGQAVIYMGPSAELFDERFDSFGFVLVRP